MDGVQVSCCSKTISNMMPLAEQTTTLRAIACDEIVLEMSSQDRIALIHDDYYDVCFLTTMALSERTPAGEDLHCIGGLLRLMDLSCCPYLDYLVGLSCQSSQLISIPPAHKASSTMYLPQTTV